VARRWLPQALALPIFDDDVFVEREMHAVRCITEALRTDGNLVLRGVYSDTTQLNSTDPVEQRTAKSVVFFVYDVTTYKLSQLGHYVH